jgi:hypothetical protein
MIFWYVVIGIVRLDETAVRKRGGRSIDGSPLTSSGDVADLASRLRRLRSTASSDTSEDGAAR